MPSPNKIDFNGQTLIDLTSDTVTPETLANGVTAHNASGVVITGAMTPGTGDLSQIIAENFDETKDYEVGDYVIYSNCLYCFSASHLAGAWDDTEVTPVTVIGILNEKSDTDHIHDDRYYTESETDTKLNTKLNLSGGSMTGTIISYTGNGVSYIDGTGGAQAGIYVKKGSINADQWIPGIAIQTKSGGGWAIGNYNNENLQFVYGTKANIDAHNNSTVVYNLDINGNFSGKAANVTGTVAIGNGGTGATTVASARQNLFNENLASNAGYLIAITDSWAKGGYIPKGSVGSWIGGICARPNYSISTTDLTAGTSSLTTNQLYFVYV